MLLRQGLQAAVRDLAYVSSPFSQDSAPDKQHAEITQKLQIRREIQEDTNGNSRKKDSKNLLLHKNNEKTGRDDQNQLFRILEINKGFIQEKQPYLFKNSKLYDILTCPSPIPWSPAQQ